MARNRKVLQTGVLVVAAATMLSPATAFARGNPGGGGGGGGRPPNAGTETVGNNLSYPVVFAEGRGITGLPSSDAVSTLAPWQQAWTGLRIPSPTNPTLSAADTYTATDGVYYLQGQEGTSWQAGYIDGKSSPPYRTYVKWGDNIVSTTLPSSGGGTPWTTTATIHLEVSMNGAAALTASDGLKYFPTSALYGSGSTETFGASAASLLAGGSDAAGTRPKVYSEAAYLTIAPVSGPGGTVTGPAIHTLATWSRAVEGPSSNALTPEVNASGNVVYSYNWFAGRDHLSPGYYRLTFGIATPSDYPAGSTPPPVTGNASIAGVVGPAPAEGETGSDVACGTTITVPDETTGTEAQVPLGCDTAANQSTIDIQLVSGSTGTGGGTHGNGGGTHGNGGGGPRG